MKPPTEIVLVRHRDKRDFEILDQGPRDCGPRLEAVVPCAGCVTRPRRTSFCTLLRAAFGLFAVLPRIPSRRREPPTLPGAGAHVSPLSVHHEQVRLFCRPALLR